MNKLTIPPQIRQRQQRIQEAINKRNERVGAIVFKSLAIPEKKI